MHHLHHKSNKIRRSHKAPPTWCAALKQVWNTWSQDPHSLNQQVKLAHTRIHTQTHSLSVTETPGEPESMVMSIALLCLASDNRALICERQRYLLGAQQLTSGRGGLSLFSAQGWVQPLGTITLQCDVTVLTTAKKQTKQQKKKTNWHMTEFLLFKNTM